MYVQADKKDLYVFDHVEAKIIKQGTTGLTLSVKNPTLYDGKVSIFAETSSRAFMPLSYAAFIHWPKIILKAGETKLVHVDSDGKVSAVEGV